MNHYLAMGLLLGMILVISAALGWCALWAGWRKCKCEVRSAKCEGKTETDWRAKWPTCHLTGEVRRGGAHGVTRPTLLLCVLCVLCGEKCFAGDPLVPDPKLTPGELVTNVPIEQILAVGYFDGSVKGEVVGEIVARDVPEAEKIQVFKEYFGAVPAQPGLYEIDHFFPGSCGGSNGIRNLWPELYAGPWGAHVKDKLEVRVLHLLRADLKANGAAHALALRDGMFHEFQAGWTNAFLKYCPAVAMTPKGAQESKTFYADAAN